MSFGVATDFFSKVLYRSERRAVKPLRFRFSAVIQTVLILLIMLSSAESFAAAASAEPCINCGIIPQESLDKGITPEGFDELNTNNEFKDIKPEEVGKGRSILKQKENKEQSPAPPPSPSKPEESLFERYISDSSALEVSTKLKPFGYDLFNNAIVNSSQDLPVASDYIIGPDDEINILVWGRINGQYTLTVSREGMIHFPNIGPINVSGMTFEEMKKAVTRRVKNIIGTEISITMGRLRSIQVFVLGEVKKPGAYTVSAMSTLTNALMLSGGPTGIGSLRKVELKRDSKTVIKMDFYDLLLTGDKSKDLRLHNGDVIFVPTVGSLVGIAGNIKRPAVYELTNISDLASTLELAGGIIPTAYTQRIEVERFEGNEKRIVIDINAKDTKAAGRFKLQDGDLVKITAINEKDVNAIFLHGNVKRPGKYEIKAGMRLKDILKNESDLASETHLEYGLIKRLRPPNMEPELMPFNLRKLFSGVQGENLPLASQDSIYVFSEWFFREKPKVTIEGEVRCSTENGMVPVTADKGDSEDSAGEKKTGKEVRYKRCDFELQKNFTIKDLILLAGGATKDASFEEFELYRTDPGTKIVNTMKLNLAKAMESDTANNILLKEQDRVVVHSVREMSPKQFVMIKGEVTRPGNYEYASNWRVSDLVFAAGNLLESAFFEEAEIASGVVEGRKSYNINYRKINLGKAMAGDPAHNVALRPHDSLYVKKIPEWKEEMFVSITGEVVFPGQYLIKKGETLSSVIERAGGYTDRAYLKGVVFTRESVRLLQQKNIDEAINRFEQKLLMHSSESMQKALAPDEAKQLQGVADQRMALMTKLRAAKAIGRISINLDTLERFKGSVYDMALEEGDSLVIPDRPDQIQVIGSVHNQTAFVYDPKATMSSYIKKSGGLTRDAEKKDIYVLKVDGTALGYSSGWSGIKWDSSLKSWTTNSLMAQRLDPGDTIVVPEKLDKIAWLKETKDLTQILYQIAVTAGVLLVAF
ncbi:MAG: SLBB domain-containing protein [Deltaproteobacteria bacterium]|nr:SLBB domain-containing protein [Deltaproteobacteria bacterium]